MALTDSSSASGSVTPPGTTEYRMAIRIWHIGIPRGSSIVDDYCTDFASCCFPPPPPDPDPPESGSADDGSGFGSASGIASGSGSSTGTNSGQNIGGVCSHAWINFGNIPSWVTDGWNPLNGGGPDPDPASCDDLTAVYPPCWWARRQAGNQFAPYHAAAAQYVHHVCDLHESPSGANSLLWQSLLNAWDNYRSTHQQEIIAHCLGLPLPDLPPDIRVSIKKVRIYGGRFLYEECRIVRMEDVCRVCEELGLAIR